MTVAVTFVIVVTAVYGQVSAMVTVTAEMFDTLIGEELSGVEAVHGLVADVEYLRM